MRTAIGARTPLCSMTIRAAIGCSLGALVVPGTRAARSISFQMSSAVLISGPPLTIGKTRRVGIQSTVVITKEVFRAVAVLTGKT